jgi:hypothetical protein
LRDGVQEEAVAKAARELRKDKGRGTVKSAEWSESDGLLMFVVRSMSLMTETFGAVSLNGTMIRMHIAGHAGCLKTLELIARNYWWPQMSHYIGIYVKTCNLCNRTKLQHRRPFGELHPSETLSALWDTISVDFIVKLPESHGYDAIMNVVDSITKHVYFIPTHTTITAEGTARCKGNLTDLRRILHLSLAKGNPK